MKKSKISMMTVAAMTALFVWAGAAQAAIITIYSHNFGGSSGTNLHTLSADGGTGTGTWVANSSYRADGSLVDATWGSATLAFTPAQGYVYTLDARFKNLTTGTSNWVGAGFAKGSSTGTVTGDRFTGPTVEGRSWALVRSNWNTANQAFLGSGTSGTSSSANYTAYATHITTLDLRIVLDTTGGAGNWTTTWLAKLPSESEYTVVRATAAMLDEDVTSVGLSHNNLTGTGLIDSFTLTQIPEPASGLMLLGSMLGIGLLRRKLHG
jgi:hypothetical protein